MQSQAICGITYKAQISIKIDIWQKNVFNVSVLSPLM